MGFGKQRGVGEEAMHLIRCSQSNLSTRSLDLNWSNSNAGRAKETTVAHMSDIDKEFYN